MSLLRHPHYQVCCCPCPLMFRKPCWLDFLGTASDTISSKLPIPLTFTVFQSSLLQWFLSLGCKKECVVDVSVGTRLHNPVLWLVAVFCNSLHLSYVFAHLPSLIRTPSFSHFPNLWITSILVFTSLLLPHAPQPWMVPFKFPNTQIHFSF